jgi:hypothetical protein
MKLETIEGKNSVALGLSSTQHPLLALYVSPDAGHPSGRQSREMQDGEQLGVPFSSSLATE